jgi:hypothetical protein
MTEKRCMSSGYSKGFRSFGDFLDASVFLFHFKLKYYDIMLFKF